ncbi:interactor of constitutive active ROPs 4-like [Neltuma alba]|uniref:interactor of constitutive active ROPs 4-like n=1 Tax=Neltuma alba TaxID=207710 RepID=UPI0010A40023|nr:interactor of constitutive active ROPs 4-like [Prosopis alba]
MPRSRGSDVPQRQSPRGSHQLRTSSADSDPHQHHRPITDRSPKLVGDRRSPRTTPQSDTVNQKKLGTRIADLESQLGQAQQELKSLKDQLASAEAAKKEAQQELEKKVEKPPSSKNVLESDKTEITVPQYDDNNQETDVFEVPVDKEAKSVEKSAPLAISEPEKPSMEDLTQKKDEVITELKSKMEEKEKETDSLSKENEDLKNQLKEATSKVSAAETMEEGMILRMKQLGEELEASKANGDKLSEKLKCVEAEKEALEAEMKKLRVQTEQWRKAADAAAAVLAGGVDMNPRISERCGSMDKHFGGIFETPGGYNNNGRFIGSPGIVEDLDDGFGSSKKKGSGIRMFGDLWKKKGQK